ncbi:glycerol-3-phosphate dehydrogenase C-terminal domain-containing protein, partial [Streptomyces sioyaensis]|uniref:glycerol-3-phosphate dehydrogenase C-terminal domain-containing protein n=1 Tax=Streptomyces sioyaensis TaxID=67364 RepID=UPI0034113660
RETVVTEGSGGMLSVAGGKWTTFRHIGRTVMRKVAQLHPSLGGDMQPVSHLKRRVPLPGLADPDAVAQRLLTNREQGALMDPQTARHLATHYGTLAYDIAHLVIDDPALGERIHPDGPEIWAQVVYARDHEWAQTVDDVLRRRTTMTIRGLDTDEVRARAQDLLVQKD